MSEKPTPPTFPKGAEPPEVPQPTPEPILTPNADGIFKGQQIGVDTTKLTAYAGSLTWKIKPDGHTKKVRDVIIAHQSAFEIESKTMEDNPDQFTTGQKEEVYEKATKAILETALIGFNYEEAANHVDAGPGVLGILANEVRTFLVDMGGRVGSQHLQTLSKLVTQNISSTTKT